VHVSGHVREWSARLKSCALRQGACQAANGQGGAVASDGRSGNRQGCAGLGRKGGVVADRWVHVAAGGFCNSGSGRRVRPIKEKGFEFFKMNF
jgi:hypothetical protein